MAEPSIASCIDCAHPGATALPVARRPAARLGRTLLVAALASAVVATATWTAVPFWMTRLPHLPERLPLAWQATLSRHPLLAWNPSPGPSPGPSRDAPGPVLLAAKARGELVVAVRHYRRPALPGAPQPAEPDRFDAEMASFIATRLGIPLRLVATGTGESVADLTIAGTPSPRDGTAPRVPTAYTGGTGALVAPRGSPLARSAELRRKRVCVATGSPYAPTLADRHDAIVQRYGSAVQAVAGFMAGECDALAEDELTVARLLRLPEWRFYSRLARTLQPDNGTAQIAIREEDTRSQAWLDGAVRYWKANGALLRARQQRAADIGFEASQLQDGLICHS